MNINLNFKEKFAGAVEAGEKRQTIRPRGKRRAHPGETLRLFSGLRTKNCRKLRTETCLLAAEIDISTEAHLMSMGDKVISMSQATEIAQRDGFQNQAEFYAFFRKQYGAGKHEMILYRW